MTAANGSTAEQGTKARRQEWYERAYDVVMSQNEALAARILALHTERNPKLAQVYGPRERALYLEDTQSNLAALASSILLQAPETFSDYVRWLVQLLTDRKIPTAGLPLHFECMREVLRQTLPQELWEKAEPYWRAGSDALQPG